MARPLPPEVAARFEAAITARATRQPVAQITGQRPFWRHSFIVTPDTLDEATKSRLVTEIDEDLRAADAAIAQLPDSSRAAVRTAHLLFGELNDRIAATPARDLARTRVRVPDARKAVLVARAFLREDVSVPGIGAGRPARPVAGGTR